MLSKKSLLLIWVWFLIIILFIVKASVSLDPDFGWRLRAGWLYLAYGIPKTDPFSYTMSSFPWVDHASFTTKSMAFLYTIVGKIGLSIIFTTIVLTALLTGLLRERKYWIANTFSKRHSFPSKLGMFTEFPLLLAIAVFLPFFGIRAQVVTWLLFSILLYFALNSKLWQKWRIAFPIFFLVWANLHGGFAAGLLSLFLIVTLRSWRVKKVVYVDFAIFFASLFITLINPYGSGLWREVWSSVSDARLRWTINEWMPALFNFNMSFVFLLTLSSFLIWKYRKKYLLEELVLFIIFLLQAISSVRQVPLWTIVAFPLIIKGIDHQYNDIKKIKFAPERFAKVYKAALIMSTVILLSQIFFSLRSSLQIGESKFYPAKAVSFLKKEKLQGNVFSMYGWGGYLIWNYPEKRVYIDGRMPSWRWEANISGESNYAMKDYEKVQVEEGFYIEEFEKYKVDTVLWPVQSKESGLFDTMEDWLEAVLNRWFGRKKSDYDFIKQLEIDGWERAYEDEVSVVYQKPD